MASDFGVQDLEPPFRVQELTHTRQRRSPERRRKMGKKDETPEERAARKEKEKKGTLKLRSSIPNHRRRGSRPRAQLFLDRRRRRFERAPEPLHRAPSARPRLTDPPRLLPITSPTERKGDKKDKKDKKDETLEERAARKAKQAAKKAAEEKAAAKPKPRAVRLPAVRLPC